MDDDESLFDAESGHGDTQDDISMKSEEDNSDSMNVGEDQNPTEDEINIAEMLKTFKHVQEACSGFAKIVEKKANLRHSGVHTHARKSDTTFRAKWKSTAGASTSERASSRFSSKYFGEIIGQLNDRNKKITGDQGFGNFLKYDGCFAPRGFFQWIKDQIDLNYCDIVVGGKLIPISLEAIHLLLRIPLGGEDIAKNHNDSTKSKFLSEINESSLPLIKTFGDKLLGDSLSDVDVFWYFMVVALSTFLCANSNTLLSTKYLGALIDISKIKEWYWSKYVCDWLLDSISKYKKKCAKTIGGCIYFLATQPEMDFFFQFCPAPKGGWTFIDKMLWRSNPFGPSGNVSIEQTVETERKDNAKTVEAERNDNAKTDVLHMESLPFTEIPKESIEPVPLVAISTTGEHIDTATTPLPSHPGGSFVSAKSIGGNGLSDTHASFSNQVPWCSSSAKLAVHRPRRMVIPSKYKLSPYMMPQSKITVSRLEADVYEVVLKMAESEHRNVTVIDYGQVVVKISALASSLKPQG